MSSQCFSLVRGRALRVTKSDGCGRTLLGPSSQVVTEGFISVGLTANNEEGETISVTNAAGKVCILDEPSPSFTGYNIEVAFCGVDPELFSLMTGQPVVLNSDGTDAIGFRMNSGINLGDSGFALELWSNVPVAACDASGGASYGYFLIPFIQGGVLGDFTVENGAINFTLTGATSKDGNEWGVGPYDVVRDETGAAGPLLEPLDSKDHLHMQLTTVAPPAVSCGAAALGVPATGADAATTPATLIPANSYPPVDLADAQTGFTATPATAWASGKYVVLGDGTNAYWDGTAWVAGIAP
jgi:hypothetical protein